MEASELKRVKELEDENRRLKNMYAELSLDHQMLKIVLGKKVVSPAEKREKAHVLIEAHGSSIGRACRVVNLALSVFY